MWPQDMGKRRSTSLVGSPALPKNFIGYPGTYSDHPGTNPKTSQSSPNALLGLNKLHQTSHEPAVTKQQCPAVTSHRKPATHIPGSKEGVRRQVAEGP